MTTLCHSTTTQDAWNHFSNLDLNIIFWYLFSYFPSNKIIWISSATLFFFILSISLCWEMLMSVNEANWFDLLFVSDHTQLRIFLPWCRMRGTREELPWPGERRDQSRLECMVQVQWDQLHVNINYQVKINNDVKCVEKSGVWLFL